MGVHPATTGQSLQVPNKYNITPIHYKKTIMVGELRSAANSIIPHVLESWINLVSD